MKPFLLNPLAFLSEFIGFMEQRECPKGSEYRVTKGERRENTALMT